MTPFKILMAATIIVLWLASEKVMDISDRVVQSHNLTGHRDSATLYCTVILMWFVSMVLIAAILGVK